MQVDCPFELVRLVATNGLSKSVITPYGELFALCGDDTLNKYTIVEGRADLVQTQSFDERVLSFIVYPEISMLILHVGARCVVLDANSFKYKTLDEFDDVTAIIPHTIGFQSMFVPLPSASSSQKPEADGRYFVFDHEPSRLIQGFSNAIRPVLQEALFGLLDFSIITRGYRLTFVVVKTHAIVNRWPVPLYSNPLLSFQHLYSMESTLGTDDFESCLDYEFVPASTDLTDINMKKLVIGDVAPGSLLWVGDRMYFVDGLSDARSKVRFQCLDVRTLVYLLQLGSAIADRRLSSQKHSSDAPVDVDFMHSVAKAAVHTVYSYTQDDTSQGFQPKVRILNPSIDGSCSYKTGHPFITANKYLDPPGYSETLSDECATDLRTLLMDELRLRLKAKQPPNWGLTRSFTTGTTMYSYLWKNGGRIELVATMAATLFSDLSLDEVLKNADVSFLTDAVSDGAMPYGYESSDVSLSNSRMRSSESQPVTSPTKGDADSKKASKGHSKRSHQPVLDSPATKPVASGGLSSMLGGGLVPGKKPTRFVPGTFYYEPVSRPCFSLLRDSWNIQGNSSIFTGGIYEQGVDTLATRQRSMMAAAASSSASASSHHSTALGGASGAADPSDELALDTPKTFQLSLKSLAVPNYKQVAKTAISPGLFASLPLEICFYAPGNIVVYHNTDSLETKIVDNTAIVDGLRSAQMPLEDESLKHVEASAEEHGCILSYNNAVALGSSLNTQASMLAASCLLTVNVDTSLIARADLSRLGIPVQRLQYRSFKAAVRAYQSFMRKTESTTVTSWSTMPALMLPGDELETTALYPVPLSRGTAVYSVSKTLDKTAQLSLPPDTEVFYVVCSSGVSAIKTQPLFSELVLLYNRAREVLLDFRASATRAATGPSPPELLEQARAKLRGIASTITEKALNVLESYEAGLYTLTTVDASSCSVLLGMVEFILGQHDKALYYLSRATAICPFSILSFLLYGVSVSRLASPVGVSRAVQPAHDVVSASAYYGCFTDTIRRVFGGQFFTETTTDGDSFSVEGDASMRLDSCLLLLSEYTRQHREAVPVHPLPLDAEEFLDTFTPLFTESLSADPLVVPDVTAAVRLSVSFVRNRLGEIPEFNRFMRPYVSGNDDPQVGSAQTGSLLGVSGPTELILRTLLFVLLSHSCPVMPESAGQFLLCSNPHLAQTSYNGADGFSSADITELAGCTDLGTHEGAPALSSVLQEIIPSVSGLLALFSYYDTAASLMCIAHASRGPGLESLKENGLRHAAAVCVSICLCDIRKGSSAFIDVLITILQDILEFISTQQGFTEISSMLAALFWPFYAKLSSVDSVKAAALLQSKLATLPVIEYLIPFRAGRESYSGGLQPVSDIDLNKIIGRTSFEALACYMNSASKDFSKIRSASYHGVMLELMAHASAIVAQAYLQFASVDAPSKVKRMLLFGGCPNIFNTNALSWLSSGIANFIMRQANLHSIAFDSSGRPLTRSQSNLSIAKITEAWLKKTLSTGVGLAQPLEASTHHSVDIVPSIPDILKTLASFREPYLQFCLKTNDSAQVMSALLDSAFPGSEDTIELSLRSLGKDASARSSSAKRTIAASKGQNAAPLTMNRDALLGILKWCSEASSWSRALAVIYDWPSQKLAQISESLKLSQNADGLFTLIKLPEVVTSAEMLNDQDSQAFVLQLLQKDTQAAADSLVDTDTSGQTQSSSGSPLRSPPFLLHGFLTRVAHLRSLGLVSGDDYFFLMKQVLAPGMPHTRYIAKYLSWNVVEMLPDDFPLSLSQEFLRLSFETLANLSCQSSVQASVADNEQRTSSTRQSDIRQCYCIVDSYSLCDKCGNLINPLNQTSFLFKTDTTSTLSLQKSRNYGSLKVMHASCGN